MRGIICYYSGSGNTKLACEKIAREINNVEFTLFNIVNPEKPQLDEYDIVGFACFTDFWGVPFLMHDFIEKLQPQKSYAFVFNTFGFVSGKTLRDLDNLAYLKGFKVIAGHSLHAPESYPPMVAGGLGNVNAPSSKVIKRFNRFISEMDHLILLLNNHKEAKRKKVTIGFVNRLLPTLPRTRARIDMGEKYIDNLLCTECGICQKICPYRAIELNPKPTFNMNQCYGCWACYNHCPTKAIYTRKYRGKGHYPKPNAQYQEKIKQ